MRQMRARDEIRRQLSDAIAAALADLEQSKSAEERYQGASWLVDRFAEAVTAAGKLRARAAVALRDEENLSLSQLGERLGLSKARAADIVRDVNRQSQRANPDPRVVAVIVTAPEGVLAVRRRDKNPVWTFPSGEIEPGETASDAGVRETKEETGLDVVAGRILGRRIHPQTGRQMIYLAARPAKNADVSSIVRRRRWGTRRGPLDHSRRGRCAHARHVRASARLPRPRPPAAPRLKTSCH